MSELIERKRDWHFTPNDKEIERGFKGWHERGYLPHFDAPNVTQLVTFNLVDSFPVKRRTEWEFLLKIENDSERRRTLEEWLDRGHGPCWLNQAAIAEVVETELLAGHNRDYQLQTWVIMPNHVHLVVDVRETPLRQLITIWKGRTAFKCNRLLGRRGSFWQEDYWDTFIRDARHLGTSIRYVESNPAKARLVKDSATWRWSSLRRKDRFGVLKLNAD
ncbi:MAG: transposase [Akkermansiaceae bacterium]|nr:transposase [Verrucomicrobiales bacterium]